MKAGSVYSLPAFIWRWRLVFHNLIKTASQKPTYPGKHRKINASGLASKIMQKLCALHIRPCHKLIFADSMRDAILFQPQHNLTIIRIRHTITKERIPCAY